MVGLVADTGVLVADTLGVLVADTGVVVVEVAVADKVADDREKKEPYLLNAQAIIKSLVHGTIVHRIGLTLYLVSTTHNIACLSTTSTMTQL